MFPHVPLQAITLDLADTHSVSLTVDRVLNNTIYIPDQQQQQQQQGEESTSSEPHPLGATPTSASSPLPHQGGVIEGESSDQDTSATSSESHSTSATSSRDTSETPEQSSSHSNESDNVYSDWSAVDEASGAVRRRRRPRPRHDIIDSSSAVDTSDSRVESTSGDGGIGVASSAVNRQTDHDYGTGLRRSGESPFDVGAASFDQRRDRALEGREREGGGQGSFVSLQQRKEDMLKKARQ